MRRPPARLAALLLLAAVLAAACGSDPPDPCLGAPTYDAVILPQVVQPKCLPCHSMTLRPADRRGAPLGMDFDTYALAQPHIEQMANAITAGLEPPQQLAPELKTTTAERQLAIDWRDCGLKQ